MSYLVAVSVQFHIFPVQSNRSVEKGMALYGTLWQMVWIHDKELGRRHQLPPQRDPNPYSSRYQDRSDKKIDRCGHGSCVGPTSRKKKLLQLVLRAVSFGKIFVSPAKTHRKLTFSNRKRLHGIVELRTWRGLETTTLT